jgi:mRNA interferase MazF
MRRGEVWLVALDPTVGSEIRKTRPCLIVSPDVLVQGLRTVIVAPLTSRGRQASFRPQVRFKGTDGLIILDQIRAVDKTRLVRRVGRVDDPTLAAALAMLRWIFTE